MSVYCYLRVSTEKQGESGAGLNAQRDMCQTYARIEGFTISQEFEDVDVSRSKWAFDRPGFSEMMQVIEEGDSILVACRDRLGAGIETAILERDLRLRGIRVLSANSFNDDSDETMFKNHIDDAASQYEIAKIRSRTLRSLRAKKARGEVYCKRLYGYRAEGSRFVPDLKEQRAIRLMRTLREHGKSFSEIARALTVEGYRTPAGKTNWRHSTVREVLKRDTAHT